MSINQSVNELITKAGLICGSEYKLAQAMGLPQQVLSMWKSGARTCTPADRARLAGFAREDAVQELVRATIEGAKGVKREQLLRVLGKLSPQTGAAHVIGLLSMTSLIFGSMRLDVLRCIKSRIRRVELPPDIRQYVFC